MSDAAIVTDKLSGRSRGFGFATLASKNVAESVVQELHTIDGRQVDCRFAVAQTEMPALPVLPLAPGGRKLFVGNLAPTTREASFRAYFRQFGVLEDAVVMMEQGGAQSRGFGFVTFATHEQADSVIRRGARHRVDSVLVEVKACVPRADAVEAEAAAAAVQALATSDAEADAGKVWAAASDALATALSSVWGPLPLPAAQPASYTSATAPPAPQSHSRLAAATVVLDGDAFLSRPLETWSLAEVQAWLGAMGFAAYAPVFAPFDGEACARSTTRRCASCGSRPSRRPCGASSSLPSAGGCEMWLRSDEPGRARAGTRSRFYERCEMSQCLLALLNNYNILCPNRKALFSAFTS